jgi:CRISPR/Cas system-associated exonuclease Cas4 (RecB family)
MRGSLFHSITYAYDWRELSRDLPIDCDGETLTLVGHLDCYDPDTATVMDFKSTHMLEWQLKTGKLPHMFHVKQLQSYLFIFGTTIPIKRLMLYYMDMKTPPTPFEVPLQEVLVWAEERVKVLHRSISRREPPPKESGYLCNYCQFIKICKPF